VKKIAGKIVGRFCRLADARDKQNLMGRFAEFYQRVFHGGKDCKVTAPGAPFDF
jgi:hypothetical protein